MPYKIENGNIVSKDTSGATRKFIKQNVDIIIGECKKRGITNKYLIAGILGTISKESGFVPQNENLNYSAEGLLKIFPSKFGSGKASAQEYAKKPEKIANYVYGSKYGNSAPGDGYKFRGRGFNQITFKDLYKKYGTNIPGILENPDQLNNVSQAAIATIAYYVEGFKNGRIKKNYGKSAQDMSDWNEALLMVVNVTAGIGFSPSANNVRYNYDKAKKCHGFLIDYLEQNPQGTTTPPDNPSNVDNAAQNQQNSDQSNQNGTQQDDSGTNSGSGDNGQTNNTPPVKNLTQFFKPTIQPTEISFDIEGVSKNDKEKISREAGYQPFIWYNGVQISHQDVHKFNLSHRGILPSLEVTFYDSWGVLREDGFPHDDTLLTVYLNSKSLNLRSIHMDFKILEFKDNGNSNYTLTGICNIPEIYIRKFSSFNSKTSHEALQDIAKQCGMGFCSNINNSDDKMTWINPGFKNLEFIETIIGNSYVSETSFQYCYIDYYYNFCYMDLGKELERDVSQDKMVVGFGFKFLKGSEDDKDTDEETTTMLLSNDKSQKETAAYFSHFDIINKSTKVSIEKAFRTRTKYYDSVKKELLIFDVESQTSDGSKSIILKGAIGDEKYFNDNTSNIYVGKLDMFEDGKGNVHKNYNYSISQNRQNLDDITKVHCILTLPSNNFNLYVYQKIPIYYSPQKQTPGAQNDFYKRISGEWLITGIEFSNEGGKNTQIVKAIKRELSLLPDEAKDSKPRSKDKSQGVNNSENNVNELAPGETPAPEPTPSQSVNNNQPPPPTQVTAQDQSYYDLDYIIGSENFRDNNGKVRNLVLVDGQPVDELVAVGYLKMKEAAKKEGINISINSGFRPAYGPNLKAKTKKGKTVNITTQESLRRDKSRWSKSARSGFTTDDDFVFKAKSSAYNPATAPPGKSNHGNGIALDLNSGSRIAFSRKLNNQIYTWLVKNSWKFGFVRAVKSEEWHFEYHPSKSNKGPYAIVSDSTSNLFYSDLGLNNIRVA
jgi:predicted chitinase/LAS superfamily LD-carboxypeptidase LdcB